MKIQISKWLIVIATFVSLMFVVTGLEAGKGGVKPDKPDKPDRTKAECILFTGDLVGMAKVEGCCPNAGPYPAYTMTLDLHDENGNDYLGDYDGQLFMNFASDQGYKVQFWNWDSDNETPGDGDIFFEIYGGDIFYDRKNKFLHVTFTDEEATLWLYDDLCCAREAPVLPVSFELVKTADLSNCDE
jgi:hypothetical protein